MLALLLAVAGPALSSVEPTVRIGGAIYLGDAPTAIAQQRGLFSANGVNANVRYATAGKDNLEQLRAGRIDFALMALTPLVLDHLADASPGEDDDPVILASLVHATHLNEILVFADGAIKRPGDLIGRKVGLSRGTSAEFVWWLFTHYHGLDPDSIEVVDRPANALPEALASGAIDAALLWAPWQARLEARLERQLHSLVGTDVHTAKWVLVTRRDITRTRTSQCRNILSAYRDAIDYIQQHPDQAMRLYATHAGLDPQYLTEAWDPLIYDLNLDWNVVTSLQKQIEWARQAESGSSLPHPRQGILSFIAPGPLHDLMPAAVGIPMPRQDAAQ